MRRPDDEFLLAGPRLIRFGMIRWVDFSEIERLKIVVHHDGGADTVAGIQAIEALMLLKPSALESRRLRWKKGAWMLHNLVGHPLMQVLALFRRYRWAMKIHDVTVPRPVLE
jgi:hypothetical protein